MSARGGESLRVPIEIKTEDIQELRDIIQELKEAEQTARSAVPTTKAKAARGESRGAVRADPFEVRGGIFGGETGKVPALREKTSRQAFQRESEFSKLRDQVSKIGETQQQSLSAFDAILGGAFLTGGLGGAGKTAAGVVGGGAAGVMGSMKGLMVRLIPILIPAMLAFGLIQTIQNELLRPGGIFDRRLRINVEDQFFELSDRKEIAQLREGVRELRVTAVSSQRGPSPVSNVKDFFKKGRPFINPDQEALEKSLLP